VYIGGNNEINNSRFFLGFLYVVGFDCMCSFNQALLRKKGIVAKFISNEVAVMTEKTNVMKRVDSAMNYLSMQTDGKTLHMAISKMSGLCNIIQLILEGSGTQSDYQKIIDNIYLWIRSHKLDVPEFETFLM
jgi:hypothetical protein